MNIQSLIKEWVAASNAFNTAQYLQFYLSDAILDDPSVGRKFEGHHGIKQYFDSYFINYNTQTEIVKLNVIDKNHAKLEVLFTGDFPEGKIGGSFDFHFMNNKITFVKADIIH